MQQSLKNRLAALEAIEQQQATADELYPPVDSMTDGEVLAEVCEALRWDGMHTWHDWRNRKVWLCVTGLKDHDLEEWYWTLKPRAQVYVDAHIEAILRLIPPQSGSENDTVAAVLTILEGIYATV